MTRLIRHPIRYPALAFLAAAIFLAGCGGPGADGGEAGAPGPSAVPAEASSPAAAPTQKDTGKPAKDDKQKTPAKAAAAPAASPFGTAVLAYPDDFQMTLLAYRLTDREPPLAEWAGEERDVKYADEFSKAAKLEAETARLADIYASTEGAGVLQVRLSSQLSQYDSGRGGYYLTAFSPGNQVNFGGKEQVSLQLDNMASAFFWPVDAARAQEILEHSSRRVDLDTKVQLTGIQRRSSGLVIQGQIVEYGIYSTRYNDERQFEFVTLN
ncbi:putative lipoprotein [Hyphomonas neptunium ATCC 15444]|uniref:Putative lipoprotein n=2 Tax=Hyphomonas TaxID=85 RepID=Q0C2T1_HYPNA|nr:MULTISPECIES: hypothetical protein [Hyphomonas]ABI77171.1 putative lipoprotein [Hyphomonas neptunium ATCC 15444]KCZ95802.1 putative lipoprotein [Hyphomonas hirschiana VP5]